jgi:glycosyltransferase involved in cell wall biosynthesis
MMKLAHIIGGLNVGGAERMLQRLVTEHSQRPDISILVISITDVGSIGQAMSEAGVRVKALNINGPVSGAVGFVKLLWLLMRFRPDVVQTWLYWADLIGGIAAKICAVKAIVWNIRCAQFGDSRWTGYVVRLNARLSHWLPHSIICCGYTAKHFHEYQGYHSNGMIVLPNGFDLQYFTPPDPSATAGQHGDTVNITAIGRNDPLKDYGNLLAAAKIVVDQCTLARFFIYGRGCASDAGLQRQIEDFQLRNIVECHEELSDVRQALRRTDIFVSSSLSEGFPNVLAEAMAMGVPCVATNAGDASVIVGKAGEIAPIGDSRALADAIVKLAKLPPEKRQELGIAARKHIVENFEIGYVAQLYFDHYQKIIQLDKNEKH